MFVPFFPPNCFGVELITLQSWDAGNPTVGVDFLPGYGEGFLEWTFSKRLFNTETLFYLVAKFQIMFSPCLLLISYLESPFLHVSLLLDTINITNCQPHLLYSINCINTTALWMRGSKPLFQGFIGFLVWGGMHLLHPLLDSVYTGMLF